MDSTITACRNALEMYPDIGKDIRTNKRKNATHNPNAERKALTLPSTKVKKGSKDLLRVTFRTQCQQRNENRKESNNVQNEEGALEFRQQSPSCNVNGDTKHHHCPVEQSAVPILRLVAWSGERDKSLDQSTC